MEISFSRCLRYYILSCARLWINSATFWCCWVSPQQDYMNSTWWAMLYNTEILANFTFHKRLLHLIHKGMSLSLWQWWGTLALAETMSYVSCKLVWFLFNIKRAVIIRWYKGMVSIKLNEWEVVSDSDCWKWKKEWYVNVWILIMAW